MNSRIRFYMTFCTDWIESFNLTCESFRDVLEESFEAHGEVFISFTCDDGVAILNMISELDVITLKEIITESFSERLPIFNESDFDIEIDLDVPIEDFDDF